VLEDQTVRDNCKLDERHLIRLICKLDVLEGISPNLQIAKLKKALFNRYFPAFIFS